MVESTTRHAGWGGIANCGVNAIRDRGGFSYRSGPREGQVVEPTMGYMVALPVSSTLEARACLTFQRVKMRGLEVISKITREPQVVEALTHNPDLYMGGWHDTSTGLVFIELSINVRDREVALESARAWGQRAIYDLEQNKVVWLAIPVEGALD